MEGIDDADDDDDDADDADDEDDEQDVTSNLQMKVSRRTTSRTSRAIANCCSVTQPIHAEVAKWFVASCHSFGTSRDSFGTTSSYSRIHSINKFVPNS